MRRWQGEIQLVNNGVDESSAGTIAIFPKHRLNSFEAERLAKSFRSQVRIVAVAGRMPAMLEVSDYTEDLLALLEEQKIKRLSLLGIGEGGALAQATAIAAPKLIRRVILVNSATRVHPSRLDSLIDGAERFLPLGLPLRPLSRAFDSRPALHRLRCPVLVLTSRTASPFELSQAALLTRKIPNAWGETLDGLAVDAAGQIHPILRDRILTFLEVPAKRPQKNR